MEFQLHNENERFNLKVTDVVIGHAAYVQECLDILWTDNMRHNKQFFRTTKLLTQQASRSQKKCQQQRQYIVVVNVVSIRRDIRNPALLDALSLLPLLHVLRILYILDDNNGGAQYR
jgi:hypothetical protein